MLISENVCGWRYAAPDHQERKSFFSRRRAKGSCRALAIAISGKEGGKKKGKRTGDGIKQASCAQDSVKSAFKSHPGSRLPCAEGSWGRAIRPGLARPKLENSHFRPLTNVTGTSAPRTSRRDSLYPPGIVPQRPSRAASVTSAGWAIFPPCGISDITFLS